MKNTIYLHEKISTVCPIDGVNSSRVISFKPEATEDQRKLAQTIADAWDFDAPTKDQVNAPILAELDLLDKKSIRAIRDGNTKRISEIEAQAVELRGRLVK